MHPCCRQRNIAEAEEPRGHTKLKTQHLCSTDSGFHTKAHESLGVVALFFFFVFFALLSMLVKFIVRSKQVARKTDYSVDFVPCLSLELLYLFNQQTKKMFFKFNASLGFCMLKTAVDKISSNVEPDFTVPLKILNFSLLVDKIPMKVVI